MLLIVNHAHVSQGQFRRGRRGSDLDDAACVHSASSGVHRAPVDARASEATKMCAYKMCSTTAELVGLFTLFLVSKMRGFFDGDDGGFYTALFSALGQTHCTCL